MNMDYILLIFLLLCLLIGLLRGFYDQLYGFFAMIAAVLIACYGTQALFPAPLTHPMAVYGTVGLVSYVILKLIGMALRHFFFKAPLIKVGDHIAGMFLGVIKGFTVIFAIYLTLCLIPFDVGGIAAKIQYRFEGTHFFKNLISVWPFSSFHAWNRCMVLLQYGSGIRSMDNLEDPGDVSGILRTRSVKEVLDNDQIVEALRDYHLITVSFDQQVKTLYKDEALIKELMDMNLKLKDFPNHGLGDIIDEYFLNPSGGKSE